MLTQLIYTSRATRPLCRADLAEILTRSIANNRQNNLTGMLLYRDGLFIQLLEGNSEKINAVLRKIEADPRHDRLCVHLKTPTRTREFSNWGMGFHAISDDDLGKLAGIVPFRDGEFEFDNFVSNPKFCVDILKLFAADGDLFLKQAA